MGISSENYGDTELKHIKYIDWFRMGQWGSMGVKWTLAYHPWIVESMDLQLLE